jgi:hypothetical protein
MAVPIEDVQYVAGHFTSSRRVCTIDDDNGRRMCAADFDPRQETEIQDYLLVPVMVFLVLAVQSLHSPAQRPTIR